jgi:hypothetical protein
MQLTGTLILTLIELIISNFKLIDDNLVRNQVFIISKSYFIALILGLLIT